MSLKGVRSGEQPHGVRVVLDVSGAAPYRVQTLSNPYRVVIDVEGITGGDTSGKIVTASKVLTNIRWAPNRKQTVRVVCEVKGKPTILRQFALGGEGNARIVVDIAAGAAEGKKGQKTESKKKEKQKAGKPEPQQEKQREVQPPETPASKKPVEKDKPKPVVTPTPEAEPVAELPREPAPSVPPARKDGKRVIVIDAGHGGKDPGAQGASGVLEKEVTLAFARVIRERLEASGAYRVVLTREDDRILRLRDRFQVARDAGADLFISLHADALPGTDVRGTSLYVLSDKASDAEAEKLAAGENKADRLAGVDLSGTDEGVTSILIDLAQRDTNAHSSRFAEMLHQELKRETRMAKNALRSAGFAVLKAPDVPSILIELGFLSSPYDEKELQSPAQRDRVARAITRAINHYFKTQ